MRNALAGCVAFAVATTLMRDARASEAEFDLDYRAPAVCPSEAAFVSDVRARLVDRGSSSADRRFFRIRIVEERGAFRGALETLEPPSSREVGGDTCEEVARALIVFLALALSPGDEPPPMPTGVSPSPPLSSDVAAGPQVPLRPPSSNTAEAAPSPSTTRRLRMAVDARALAAAGLAPELAPGGALAAQLVIESRPSFRWLIHAGGALAYTETAAAFGGAFSFLWYTARFDGGPALDLGPVRLSAGPVVHAGVLSVGARNLPSAARYGSLWGDIGAFARVDHSLTRHVALSLMVELVAPLQRRSFGIQGIETPVHEIPLAIGIVSAGITGGP